LTNGRAGSRAGLLQAILYDLSLPYEGRGEQELRLALTEHLLKSYEEGRSTLLILDEAQDLTPDLLEELRLLGNLESRSGRAVQVVLVGQPTLLETLRRRELAALWQRVAIRAQVEALPLQEAADYLLHHVRVSGGKPERLFADEALELLSRQTGGIPRLLNQAAHQALRLAAEAGGGQVDAEAALEALAMLGLAEEVQESCELPVLNSNDAENEPPEEQNEANPTEEIALMDGEDSSCRLLLATARAD
jgi:type II secretory pathway predicted ATPase ExeA